MDRINFDELNDANRHLWKYNNAHPDIEQINDELRSLPYEDARSLAERVIQLESAIRNHRDQRGDDRCWMDDEELYRVLPEGYTAPSRDTCVELKLCEKYIASRQNPTTEYVSPQRRIEELEEENNKLKLEIQARERFE